jgi:hypothetical protein
VSKEITDEYGDDFMESLQEGLRDAAAMANFS